MQQKIMIALLLFTCVHPVYFYAQEEQPTESLINEEPAPAELSVPETLLTDEPQEKEQETDAIVQKEETEELVQKAAAVAAQQASQQKEAASEAHEQPVPEPISAENIAQQVQEPIPTSPAELPTQELEEPLYINTAELEEAQGNWLFKRIWWERAEERYEKIRALVDAIWESHLQFFTQRSDLDKNVLDPFYLSIGFGQGELQELLSELIDRMEKEQKQAGMLDDAERSLLEGMQEQKKLLEQVNSAIEIISKLDRNVDAALARLMEEMNKVKQHEQGAWQDFKEIARILNDKKARDLYYKMDIAWKNIKDISVYINREFMQHFQKLASTITQEVDRLRGLVQSLRERGIDFKEQAARLEQKEEVSVQEKDEEEAEEQEIVTQGWLASMYTTANFFVLWIWDSVTAPFTWVYRKIVGSPAAVSEDEDDEDKNEQE